MKKQNLISLFIVLSMGIAHAQDLPNDGGFPTGDMVGDGMAGGDVVGPGMGDGNQGNGGEPPRPQSNGSIYHEQCPLNVIDPFNIQEPLENFARTELTRRQQEFDAEDQACKNFQAGARGNSIILSDSITKLKEKLNGKQSESEKQPDNPYEFNGVQITCGNYGGWFETLNTQFWKHFEHAHDSDGKFAKDLVSQKFSWFDSQSGKGTNCLTNYESEYEADKDNALSKLTSCLQNKNDEMMFHVETSCESKYEEYTEANREERRQSTKDAYANAAGDAIQNASDYIDVLFGMNAETQQCPAWRATLESVMNVAEDLSMISGNPLVSIGASLGRSIFSGIMRKVHKRGADEAERFMNLIDDKKHYETALCHAWEADKASCDLKDLIKLENRFGDNFKCHTQEKKEISPIVDLLSGIDGMDSFLSNNIYDADGNRRTVDANSECFTPQDARPGDVTPLKESIKQEGDKIRTLFGKTKKENDEDSDCSYQISQSSNIGRCAREAYKSAKNIKDLMTKPSKNAEEVYGAGATQLDFIEKYMIPSIEKRADLEEITRDWDSTKKTSEFLKEFVQSMKTFDPSKGPRKSAQEAANMLQAMNRIQEELVLDYDSEEFKIFGDLLEEIKPDSADIPESVLYNGIAGSDKVDIDNIKSDSSCAHALVAKAKELANSMDKSNEDLKSQYGKDASMYKFLEDFVVPNADPAVITPKSKEKLSTLLDSFKKNRNAFSTAAGGKDRQVRAAADFLKAYQAVATDKNIPTAKGESKFKKLINSAKSQSSPDSIKNLYMAEKTIKAGVILGDHLKPLVGDVATRRTVSDNLKFSTDRLMDVIASDNKIKRHLQTVKRDLNKRILESDGLFSCKYKNIRKCSVASKASASDDKLRLWLEENVAETIKQCYLFGDKWRKIDETTFKHTCRNFVCWGSPKESNKCQRQKDADEYTDQVINNIVSNRSVLLNGCNDQRNDRKFDNFEQLTMSEELEENISQVDNTVTLSSQRTE